MPKITVLATKVLRSGHHEEKRIVHRELLGVNVCVFKEPSEAMTWLEGCRS
jgi:hypothetical protein